MSAAEQLDGQIELSTEDFDRLFSIEENQIIEGSKHYEPQGQEFEHVKKMRFSNRVWTCVNIDGATVFVNGMVEEAALFFFTTAQRYNPAVSITSIDAV